MHGETFRIREIPWDGKALGAPPSYDIDVKVSEDQWMTLYRASLEEQYASDFVMANWFCSTHPDSAFVRRKIVSRVEMGARHMLIDRDLEARRNGRSETKTLVDEAEYRVALREVFHIDLDADEMLRW